MVINPSLVEQTNKVVDLSDPLSEASEFIYADFKARTLLNKLCRILYCFLKMIHTSVWFYFLPFSVIYLSYAIPFRL